jgi:hypothetical protein
LHFFAHRLAKSFTECDQCHNPPPRWIRRSIFALTALPSSLRSLFTKCKLRSSLVGALSGQKFPRRLVTSALSILLRINILKRHRFIGYC